MNTTRTTADNSFFSVISLAALGGAFSFSIMATAQAASLSNQMLGIAVERPEALLFAQKLTQAASEVDATPSVRQLLRESKRNSIKLSTRISSKMLETAKFQHFYNDLEVVGSMTLHHVGTNGMMIDDQMTRFDLETQPTLSMSDATALAESLTNNQQLRALPVLKILPSSEEGSARLVYFIEIDAKNSEAGRSIVIDAHSGNIIANFSAEEELAPIYVVSAQGLGKGIKVADFSALPMDQKVELVKANCEIYDEYGSPFMLNPDNCTPMFSDGKQEAGADESAKQAAAATQKVLEYYQNVHNRDGYDGKGSPLVSVVHVGVKFDNAFWNPQTEMMAYGEGDGTTFGDFTGSLDVIGHEITHGVTMKTAQLLMMDQSGSLNEAYSDFFGRMIADDGDWAVGRKIFLDPNAKGIRDLQNPASLTYKLHDEKGNVTHTGSYPSTLTEIATLNTGETCDQTNDRCFVHINSTEASHASYLIVQAIGKDKAQALIFATLTQKITAKTNFKTNAQSTVDACNLMYDAATCSKVVDAFAQTGIQTAAKKLRKKG